MEGLIKLKAWLSLPLFGVGIFNMLVIFEVLGRQNKTSNPQVLRKLHKTVGWMGFLWMLFISLLCVYLIKQTSGAMTPRGAVHALTALILLFLMMVKILIVRSYRKLYSFVPGLGMVIFASLMTTLVLSSGTYFLAHSGSGHVHADSQKRDLVKKGQSIFNSLCAGCHYSDSSDRKIGPGLKGLSRLNNLPLSGRPVTRENLLDQLNNPYGTMPSFQGLSEEHKKAIIEFLLTL
ncbi:c-type cytochrome [Thermodesulforhabdus norvegica]|uniref:Cytochrome c, mono-and diheme variants n=1 Tax=Thermodesulforhabdus norvegica TaxID=39841 RepID=A0A1I4S328_9BACT|nr:cytochrome c [Thermodesulforhabdus norvegica]SFM58932.1 Cytochrome c, mono-and diheme variants [Thermodesulforhabdus norvegica]